MILVTPYGRYDRASVVARAKKLQRREGKSWADAMSAAYREASDQLRAYYNRPSRVAINQATEAA